MTRKSREPEPSAVRRHREGRTKPPLTPKNRLLAEISEGIHDIACSLDALNGEIARIGDLIEERFPVQLIAEIEFGEPVPREDLPS